MIFPSNDISTHGKLQFWPFIFSDETENILNKPELNSWNDKEQSI